MKIPEKDINYSKGFCDGINFCIDYMIDTSKRIKKDFKDMKKLLKIIFKENENH